MIKIKKAVKKGVEKLFRLFGFYIKRKQKECYNLQDFLTRWPNCELFMQYVYSIIVKKGDYAIDVGANHGIHTIPLSELVGDSGKVIACDAILSNINDIKSKLILDNVSFHCAALTKPDIAKEKQEITFHYFPYRDGFSGIKRRPYLKDKVHIVTVPTTTLDKIIEDLNLKRSINITFIKIDVEGGDFDVLLGSEVVLKRYKPVVVFENLGELSAKLYNYTKDEYFSYFNNLGYKLFKFTGDKFSENDWDKKSYLETWMVHKDSEYLNFFEQHYSNFAYMYMTQRQNAYKTKRIDI